MRKLLLIVSLVALFTQCDTTPTVDELVYRPSYLGPLVIAQLDPIDIAETINKDTRYTFTAAEIGIPGFDYNTPLNLPPFGPIDLPPDFGTLNKLFASIEVNAITFRISFTNTLPISINEGTRIVGRDSLTGDIMFSHTLPTSVAPGQQYEGIQEELNKTLTASLATNIENLSLPGSSEVIFTEDPIVVLIQTVSLDLKRVQLRPDRSIAIENTSSFSFDLTDTEFDSDPTGTLSLFITNNLPAAIELDLSLTNSSGATVFQLFGNQPLLIPASSIDANGISTAPTAVDLVDFIALDTVASFADASQLNASIQFITPPSASLLQVLDDNYLKLQLTADITATVIDNNQ